MGREVRRVPANWQHPKNDKGGYIPLYRGDGGRFAKADKEWNEGYRQWQKGLREDWAKPGEYIPLTPDERGMRFSDWHGGRPSPDDYMPDWPESERTHLMMYEDTSEGTPISPAFATPEELAQWLADNKASMFGYQSGTYEQWLPTCKGGWAPSMVLSSAGLQSGVEFLANDPDKA